MFKFNENTPKKIKFNSLSVVKLIYNNIIVWLERVLKTVTGYPITLENSTGDDLVDYKIYGNSVQDGEPTPDSPIEVESLGDKTANLCSGDDDIYYSSYNRYSIENKTVTTTGPTLMGFIVKVEPNTEYTVSYNVISTVPPHAQRVREYSDYPTDWSENFVTQPINSAIAVRGKAISTFTTNENTKYIVFGFYTNSSGTVVNEFQVEKGSIATEYELYGYKIPIAVSDDSTSKTSTIYLDEPLRKVGDYADYIDFKNNKVVRKVTKINFNGTEGWILQSINEHGIANFSTYSVKSSLTGANFVGLSNYLTVQRTTIADTKTEGFFNATKATFYIRMLSSRTPDVDSFKEWLSHNNIMLFYPLNEPTEETIELPIILTQEGTNIIEVNTAIEPSNMKVEYYAREV